MSAAQNRENYESIKKDIYGKDWIRLNNNKKKIHQNITSSPLFTVNFFFLQKTSFCTNKRTNRKKNSMTNSHR